MKPTLLVLTPRYPYPVVGGDRLRIHGLCRALSRHFDLTLLSLCETGAELQAPVPDDGVFSRVERIRLPRWRSWLNTLLALPGRRPLQTAYYDCPAFAQRAAELAALHDGVLVHLARLGDMTRHLPGPTFLEMTDALSLNYRRVRLAGGGFSLLHQVYRVEEPRMHVFERTIVDDFDHAFLISDVDRQYLFGDNPARLERTHVVTNGVDVGQFAFQFAPHGTDLVFIGNMTTLPNRDAVLYLGEQILPLVRQAHPATVLRVIGRIGAHDRAALAHLPHVRIMGEVDSVADAARGAGAGVCPMRLGSGVQNKLLEYMALGLPAVSTSIGLEGVNARPGAELELADDPLDFAARVIALLSDRSHAETMARAARHFVETRHDWQAVTAPMVEVIRARLAERAHPGPR